MEAISEGEWNSFNGMCPEEADFMAQLLGNCSVPSDNGSNYSTGYSNFWPSHHENSNNISGVHESEMYSFPRGAGAFNFPSSSHESYYNSSQQIFVGNNNLMTMDYGLMESNKNNVMEADDFLNQDDISNDSIVSDEKPSQDVLNGRDLQLGREHEVPVPEEKTGSLNEISKKRTRVPGEYQRGKRSMKLKKCLKVDDDDEDNNNNNTNATLRRQTSSGCCSEDESNASHEGNGVDTGSSSKGGGALNLSGRTRASRGSATDPQSLYARKRRERINERLKTLQNLVPNGTKVDISTMLEEAVQYVKFLQLQIKLLSSDDMWMYAPLAYNGMDLGLDLQIASHRSRS